MPVRKELKAPKTLQPPLRLKSVVLDEPNITVPSFRSQTCPNQKHKAPKTLQPPQKKGTSVPKLVPNVTTLVIREPVV
jgi:hypothetical protein